MPKRDGFCISRMTAANRRADSQNLHGGNLPRPLHGRVRGAQSSLAATFWSEFVALQPEFDQ